MAAICELSLSISICDFWNKIISIAHIIVNKNMLSVSLNNNK